MTDATTAATSNTSKPTARVTAPLNYEIPKFGLPNMEMPEALRETAEKAVAQAKATAHETTELLKDTYANVTKGTADYNLKIIEFARANTNNAFEYAQELMAMKHPSDLVALSTAHAHKQFETMIAQAKELAELAQKVTTDTTAPLKVGVTKALKAKVA